MFPGSHFLSDRKQSTMSKRVQERKIEGGLAVAKQSSACLVSRNLSAGQTPVDPSAPHSHGNQELDQSSVSWSARKLVRNNNQDPTTHSQEWRPDDTPSSGTRKVVRSGESANLSEHQETGDIQIRRTRFKFHKCACFRPSVPRESLQELPDKVESRRRGTSTRY